MPNHITHRCVITGSKKDIDRFISRALRDEVDEDSKETWKQFDFNAFIPRPKEMDEVTACTMTAEFFALGHTATAGNVLLDHLPADSPIRDLLGPLNNPLTFPWVVEKGIKTREELLAWFEKENPQALENARKTLENKKKYGFGSWYGWNTANWGTKWNSYDFNEISREDGRYEFTFDTAWSPPLPIFEKIAEEFPTLQFSIKYFDEGFGFAGEFKCHQGKAENNEVKPSKEFYTEVYGEPPYDDEFDESEEAADNV